MPIFLWFLLRVLLSSQSPRHYQSYSVVCAFPSCHLSFIVSTLLFMISSCLVSLYLSTYLLLISPTGCKLYKTRDFCLFYSVLQQLDQCLTHSRCPKIFAEWMNPSSVALPGWSCWKKSNVIPQFKIYFLWFPTVLQIMF